jgi:5-methylcytosine-specific restriction endonuclease McrA
VTAGTCKRCGAPTGNPDGRQWYCDGCRDAIKRERPHAPKVRKPCYGCGRDKEPGARRRYCDACTAADVAGARHRERTLVRVTQQYHGEVRRLVVLERDDGICGLCGHDVDPFDFHVDHVVPLSAGGTHSYANVQVAHPFCNMAKGARH